jgi:hypothetical protein
MRTRHLIVSTIVILVSFTSGCGPLRPDLRRASRLPHERIFPRSPAVSVQAFLDALDARNAYAAWKLTHTRKRPPATIEDMRRLMAAEGLQTSSKVLKVQHSSPDSAFVLYETRIRMLAPPHAEGRVRLVARVVRIYVDMWAVDEIDLESMGIAPPDSLSPNRAQWNRLHLATINKAMRARDARKGSVPPK